MRAVKLASVADSDIKSLIYSSSLFNTNNGDN